MMNCETIDSILDDHLVVRLTGAERQRAAEHMSGCGRCSAAWAADDALRGEAIADPAPEAFPALLRRVAAAPAQRKAAARSRWSSLVGIAAAVAAVAIAVYVVRNDVDLPAVRFTLVKPDTTPAAASAPTATAELPFAGRGYEVLPGATARAAGAASGKIEVIEFFMFWCSPCYAFEPELDRWEAQAPSDVSLIRVPALFNAAAQLQARAYYTAEVLGKLDVMQDAFFDEIHERGNALASRTALADFFLRFGVEAETFDATFDSREVDARLQRADALNREYGVAATPTLVVGGRYATNGTLSCAAAGAPPDQPCVEWGSAMLSVVDRLVAESRTCRDRCVEAARER
jgi:thiol:disulfide interchange protein DsbA